MPNYVGRLSQLPEVQNFLGINSKSSIVSGVSGEAIDIDNWDIDLSGSITRRLGYATQYSFGDTSHFASFVKANGARVYVAVSGGNLWEAASPAGPWTNQGGSLTTGDFTYIGTDLNGQYVLCNGVDKPIVFVPGSSVQTLENASILTSPTNLSVTPTGGSGVAWQYCVSASTVRGETLPCNPVTTMNGPGALSTSAYNTLDWTPPAGAYTQTVYRYNSTANAFYKIALLAGTATQYVDNGSATEDIYTYPATSNTAYNTPADWNTNGQPEGVFVLARGKDQRLVAWRGPNAWASALSNIYDWYSSNDSFAWTLFGGQDNNIKAAVTLFDYTLLFSQTNCFVYTGSNYSDIDLKKILETGCSSHYSTIRVADDVYIWSQFGPTKVSRILAGADIQTDTIGAKISPITFGGINYTVWNRIRGWHDISRQRIVWAVPSTNSTVNDMCLAYNYQTKGWTKFSGWSVEDTTLDTVNKLNYAAMAGGKIVLLHSGNSDGGSSITNSYTSVFYDERTYTKKRLVFMDVLMDASTPYQVTVTSNMDFGTNSTQVSTLAFDGTTATTDGQVITLQGNTVNTHRIVMQGYGRQHQLVFSDTGSSAPAKVFGWRPELRAYGVR